MPYRVVSVTVSLEISDSNYGNGGKRFVSLRAEVPPEQEAASLNESLTTSLDLHLAAFESVYAAMVAGGSLESANYNDARALFQRRMGIIKANFAANPLPEESK